MTNVSKTSMDFIKVAGQKVKGKFGKALLATLIMVAPLMLCVFTVYAIPLAVLLFGVFQTGYIRYMRALINNENPNYALLFSEFKEPWVEIFLGALMICMFVVGTVLAIVPGAILIAYFSMSLFVAEKEKTSEPGTALKECGKKMTGNIASMFAYKTFFWVFYIIAAFIGGILFLFGIKFWGSNIALSILMFGLGYIVTTLIWSIITVYYHVANELFFQEVLYYEEVKSARKGRKKVEIINENGEDVATKEETAASEVKAEETVEPDKKEEKLVKKTDEVKKTAKKSTKKENK